MSHVAVQGQIDVRIRQYEKKSHTTHERIMS